MHSFSHNLNARFIRILSLITILLSVSLSAQASGKFKTQKRYLYVQPGQSVFNIVKVLYPNQQKHWPRIIKNIVRVNPHAFIGADATRIQAGERIELPPLRSTVRPPKTNTQTVVYTRPRSVGQVIKTRGKTFAISKKNKRRNLDLGSEVFVGDRVYTGVKGFIRLSMIDEAKIDLRCNSEMVIEDYQLLRGANRSVLHLIKGSVKKITGSIGKMADDVYEMKTPLATVGVRGTEYAIRVLQTYGCDGSVDVNSQGMFVKVNKGAIDLKSKKQKLALQKGEATLLANKESQFKKIQARDGVFEAAQDEKKSTFFGSLSWMLLFAPVLVILRLFSKDGSRRSATPR